MIGRGVIIAAVLVYLSVVVGCMLGTSVNPSRASDSIDGVTTIRPPYRQAQRAPRLPLCGAAMQLQRIDYMGTYYRKSVDEIANLGADSVMFVVNAKMENGGSTRIFLDMRLTPDPKSLGDLIDYAKSRGLRVVLMPIVLLERPRGMEWRGTIKPQNTEGDPWAEWWQSYRDMLLHYCWIAESHGVDVLVIGSELVSTENKADEWDKTIEMVRTHFKGMITYSANWDHYKDIPFWEQLDLIGMNSYYKLGEDHNVSVEEIRQRWGRIQRDLLAFQRQKGKPLVLLEAGWCSLQNAAHEPWDYTLSYIPTDLDLQRKLYEGFFQSWWGVKGFGGFMMWEWTAGDGGPSDRGYTPEGKPAEKVLRDWLAKPRWSVQ